MNNFTVTINGTPYTGNAVFPFKFANLLDEQLDEAYITLKRINEEYFLPLTPVTIEVTSYPGARYSSLSEVTSGKDKNGAGATLLNNRVKCTMTFNMVVANDKAIEIIGARKGNTKKYNHELYLIEQTKILEGYIGDSITFTNPLGNSFLTKKLLSWWGGIYQPGNGYQESDVYILNPFTVDDFYSPTSSASFTFPDIKAVGETVLEAQDSTSSVSPFPNQYIKLINKFGEEIFRQAYYVNNDQEMVYEMIYNGETLESSIKGEFGAISWADINFYLPPKSITNVALGVYTLEYGFCDAYYFYQTKTSIAITTNRLPLRKWTITDVIDRIFDVIIPLRKGEHPKFILDDSLRTKYDNIIAPEFAFTKMTLREMLKQVGGFVHAEPRIKGKEDGQWVVTFDEYGSNQTSWISNRRYVSATFGTDINDYCTSLDSSADNLVNQLNWAQGVVTEPFNGSQGKSLRTETTTTRMAEDNSTFISTDLPIYTIGAQKQVICTHIPGLDDNDKGWDITPYIFEKADYDNLSSYDGVYPFSKAYALYYTQGAKNIKGLFFKVPNAVNPSLEQYAIKNILEAVTGRNLSITGQNYMKLAFKVTYLPIFSARVRTNKQYIVGGTPRTLAYNQSANFIESQYYGENLKGVVARLGNVEKTYTYHLAHLCDIPKVGLLYDKYYYISAVSCEILPTYIKCTIALSKDFNRLSTYVGISSNKRMWEVSEKQAFERESIITEYVKITEYRETSDNNVYAPTNIANILFNASGITKPVSCAEVNTYTKSNGVAGSGYVTLPVVSTAMGNSMLFSFRFEDNYSAGQQSVYKENYAVENNANVSGYWGNYVSYCDYYGRFYYLYANLTCDDVRYDNTNSFKFPQGSINGRYIISIGCNNTELIYRKDSREIPSITYELTAVTDIEDLIIGSALMKNCALVNAEPSTYQLYGFKRRLLNTIDSKNINITDGTLISNGLKIETDFIEISGVSEYMSWAIVTKSNPQSLQVENEDGEETTQTIELGQELVLGRNSSIGGTYYFSVKKDVYS